MKAIQDIAEDLRGIASDMREHDRESDAAHRVWVAAKRLEEQADMAEKGLLT